MIPDVDPPPTVPAAGGDSPSLRARPTGTRLATVAKVAGAAALAASLGLHFAVMLVFAFRWDRAAAATVFPFWVWGIAGLALALAGALLLRHRTALVPAAIWLVSVVACADETRGLAGLVTAPRAARLAPAAATVTPADTPAPPAGHLRLVSLNCRRSPEAALAVEPLAPDLVLFQEAPHFRFVRDMCRRLFGDEGAFIYGVDTAVIARGRLRITRPGIQGQWVQATLTPPGSRPIELLNLHLIRPVVRYDLWSRSAWRTQFYNRRARDLQMRDLLSRLLSTAGNRPAIVAGDFNAPAGDRIFRQLDPHFVDTFAVAGVGWCNNRAFEEAPALPFARTDQVWVTREFRTLRHRAVSTGTSINHRMVVVDLALEPLPPP